MGIFSRLFEGLPARFDSTLAATKALSELRLLIRWGPARLHIQGEVTAESIMLYLATPRVRGGNARFEGRLETTPTGTALIGRFVARKHVRVISTLGVACAGMMFIGVLLASLAQMIMDYRGMHDLVVRLGAMLATLAVTVVIACLFAWNGCPLNREVERVSRAISTALREEV